MRAVPCVGACEYADFELDHLLVGAIDVGIKDCDWCKRGVDARILDVRGCLDAEIWMAHVCTQQVAIESTQYVVRSVFAILACLQP